MVLILVQQARLTTEHLPSLFIGLLANHIEYEIVGWWLYLGNQTGKMLLWINIGVIA